MKQLFSETSDAVLNLIFPIYCQGCGVKLSYDNKRYLCEGCFKNIKLKSPPLCIKCGKSVSGDKESKSLCAECLNRNYHFAAAWQCCEYEGLIKELIHKFKYNGKLLLKGVLGEILCGFAKSRIDYKRVDAIVAVPMHRANFVKRGFNQAAILSEILSKSLDIPFLDKCLSKIKNTKQQVSLNRNERSLNIRDAFCVKKGADIKGKRLLLVDDVFTTGATVDECSKVLNAQGAKAVWVLVLARGI